MAGSRKPGPLGLHPEDQDQDEGTTIRGRSPCPGPIGARVASADGHGMPSVTVLPAPSPRKKTSRAELKVLRLGSRGPEVQKLQRQLNARFVPSPNLAVDGIFGPLTHQAVRQYQKGISVADDGIVGKRTWYHLLRGDQVTVGQAPVPKIEPPASRPDAASKSPAAVQPPKFASLPTATAGIWEWQLEDKFADTLRRTVPKLPGSMRHEFEVLLSPTSLGIMAGTFVAWAGSHAFGVGEVVDVVLLVGGAFFLGMSVFDVAAELGDFLVVTSTAADEKDLDEAASHLARAIAILGVAAFIALLTKVARGRRGANAGESTPASTARPTATVSSTPTQSGPTQRSPSRHPEEVGTMSTGRVQRPTRAQALRDLYNEAKQLGVEIVTDADPDIKAYMDNAAKREGVPPKDMHAITLGDTIVVRQEHADNVRVLREELIHSQQQASGMTVGPGRRAITEMELDARRQLLENKDKWQLTDAEAAEIEREISRIIERGRY